MKKITIHFTVNHEPVTVEVEPNHRLIDVLRNNLGLTSVKEGCSEGECGACTVLIDGETYNSCIYLAVWAEGKHITTLEGLLTYPADMFCTVFVGNRSTRIINGRLVTPRGYRNV